MTCHDLQDLLVAYAGDELAPAQRDFVALHLDRCATCQAQVNDLDLTRRQLTTLAADRYQPQLNDRIMEAIARRRVWVRLDRWARVGARLGGAVAAVLLLAFAIAHLWQGGLDGLTAPAGPPPGERLHLLDGHHLLTVDAGSRWVNQLQLDLQADQRPLALSPDGKRLWLLRQGADDTFAIDAFDLATGESDRDRWPKPGQVAAGTSSPDGRYLYLLGFWRGAAYVKMIPIDTREVAYAYLLEEWDDQSATIHVTSNGKSIYVLGSGKFVTIALQSEQPPTTLMAPGLAPVAAISPDGRRIATATPKGIIIIDAATGDEVGQATGGPYRDLHFSTDGRWLYGSSGDALEIRTGERLTPVGKPIPLAPVD